MLHCVAGSKETWTKLLLFLLLHCYYMVEGDLDEVITVFVHIIITVFCYYTVITWSKETWTKPVSRSASIAARISAPASQNGPASSLPDA